MFSFALVSVRATNGREERAQNLGQAKLASALEQEHKGSTVQNIFILKCALSVAVCVHLTAAADSIESAADWAAHSRESTFVLFSAKHLNSNTWIVSSFNEC